MVTDPIANTLCIIRNGIAAKKKFVVCPWSKQILAILNIMLNEGYISGVVEKSTGNNVFYLVVTLKYKEGVSAIRGLKRVSKPGFRVYCGVDKLPIIMNGMGMAIISSNRGIMDEKTSRKLNVGGEVLAYIW